MERRKFTREFKLEAVKLIQERGGTVAQATRDLGVHGTVLRRWVQECAADSPQAFPGQGQMKPEQAELARLRREVLNEVGSGLAIVHCVGEPPVPWRGRFDLNSPGPSPMSPVGAMPGTTSWGTTATAHTGSRSSLMSSIARAGSVMPPA